MGDRKVIIALSGEICTGKTTLATKLEQDFGFKRCKTREALAYFAEKQPEEQKKDRSFLQCLGEKLDTEGGGKWVLEYFQHLYHKEFAEHNYFLVDSVRILCMRR
jgi:adenylosuccinate synthase